MDTEEEVVDTEQEVDHNSLADGAEEVGHSSVAEYRLGLGCSLVGKAVAQSSVVFDCRTHEAHGKDSDA